VREIVTFVLKFATPAGSAYVAAGQTQHSQVWFQLRGINADKCCANATYVRGRPGICAYAPERHLLKDQAQDELYNRMQSL